MGKSVIFYLMVKDKVCAKVTVNTSTLEITNEQYSSVPHETVFGKCPLTMEYLNKFFRRRCFEEGRPDKKELLDYIGLKEYSPFEIVKKTHGIMSHDNMWVKFEGESITFKDLKG